MPSKFTYYSYILVALASIAATRYYWPEVQTKVEYKDRIVTETKVVTKIKVVKAPNGTETTETEIVDTGSSTRDTSLVALKLSQKQYIVGAGTSFEWGHFQQPEYNLTIGRRLLGPLLGAVTVSKDRVNASLLLEF